MIRDWIIRLGFITALLGLLLSLGMHLAAWGGINADLAVPGLVQVVRGGAVVAAIIGILTNSYLFLNSRWRATYIRLPAWLRLVMQWSGLLLVGYWLVYSAATFSPFSGTGDAAALVQFRDESCRWLSLYGVFLQAMIQVYWSALLLMPHSVPDSPVPR